MSNAVDPYAVLCILLACILVLVAGLWRGQQKQYMRMKVLLADVREQRDQAQNDKRQWADTSVFYQNRMYDFEALVKKAVAERDKLRDAYDKLLELACDDEAAQRLTHVTIIHHTHPYLDQTARQLQTLLQQAMHLTTDLEDRKDAEPRTRMVELRSEPVL